MKESCHGHILKSLVTHDTGLSIFFITMLDVSNISHFRHMYHVTHDTRISIFSSALKNPGPRQTQIQTSLCFTPVDMSHTSHT